VESKFEYGRKPVNYEIGILESIFMGLFLLHCLLTFFKIVISFGDSYVEILNLICVLGVIVYYLNNADEQRKYGVIDSSEFYIENA
jgi:hypothetical protein